jgi:hypothetical protein
MGGEGARVCAECGAPLAASVTCREIFDQMMALEFQHFTTYGSVHHLSVLCYNVQHPAGYTDDYWRYAAALLTEAVEGEMPAEVLRARMRGETAPGRRAMKIRGAPEMAHAHAWTMRCGDIPLDDADRYTAGVRAWARSIVDVLRY